MKNFLTLLFVLSAAQAAFADENCGTLPAATLTCTIPTGTIEIVAQPQLSCDGSRGAEITVINRDGGRSEPTIAYDLRIVSNGEHAPLKVRYNKQRGDASTRTSFNCLK